MKEHEQTYCTFRLAGRLYGVPIEDVKEVTAEPVCTRIPHAPEEVVGLVNIRGHIFLALNLRRLLGVEARTDSESLLILFKQAVGPAFGVLVDEIGDVVSVDVSQVEPFHREDHETIPGDSIRRVDVIAKVCRLPNDLLVVLEPRKFLRIIEQSLAAVG